MGKWDASGTEPTGCVYLDIESICVHKGRIEWWCMIPAAYVLKVDTECNVATWHVSSQRAFRLWHSTFGAEYTDIHSRATFL